ncbi:MAG: hypothetical protein LUD81_10205 [Clostridiales bacterium]|nr:hypothetical protein [Clostridiales bacterium]
MPFFFGLSVLMLITGGGNGGSFSSALSKTYGVPLGASIFYSFLLIVYIIVCAAAAAAIIIYSIIRFYQSMLGNEGYITHTLPVKTGSLIIVKNLTMVIWVFLTMVVIFTCSYVLFHSSVRGMISAVYNAVNSAELLSQMSKAELTGFAVIAIIDVLASFSRIIMTIYASMAVGFSFNKGKKIISFLAYLVLQYIIRFISTMFVRTVINSRTLWIFLPDINTSLIWSVVMTLAVTAVMFFIARYFLKNRLNLQ